MSDKENWSVGGVPMGIVKGGTSSSAYDNQIAKEKAEEDGRRAREDAKFAVAQRGVQQTPEGLIVSRMGSANFVGRDSLWLVLYYLKSDGTVRQECKSEITMIGGEKQGEIDSMFAMVCPRCLERGVPQGRSQMMIRNSHRQFHIDERRKGDVVVLTDPWGRQHPVILCGTVSCDDVIRCDNYNCTYAVRIENSNVREV